MSFGSTPSSPWAAYVFDVQLGSNYCVGTVNSVGLQGRFSAEGSASVGDNDLTLFANDAPPDRVGVFLYGDVQVLVPLGDGIRCVGNAQQLARPVRTDAAGGARRAIDFTLEPVLSDIAATVPGQWNFQFWHRDSPGSNLSEARAIDLLN